MEPYNSFSHRGLASPGSAHAHVAQRWHWRVLYALWGRWRRVRVGRFLTYWLGPQYRRSRDLIEIDITYACNLHCLNCNRSVAQAPDAMHMPKAKIAEFVNESISRGKRWRRIRVLGGEPTMHPEFNDIVQELLRYVQWNPTCIVELVTNGHGAHVEAELARLPREVWIDNSQKMSPIQPHFGPFNLAPIDDPGLRDADFRNACFVASSCGMGLTPMGYYPCAVAGGIDRIVGSGRGRTHIPEDADDMLEVLEELCRFCGRFRDGHYVPPSLRTPLLEERKSETWHKLYAQWRRRRDKRAVDARPDVPPSDELTRSGA